MLCSVDHERHSLAFTRQTIRGRTVRSPAGAVSPRRPQIRALAHIGPFGRMWGVGERSDKLSDVSPRPCAVERTGGACVCSQDRDNLPWFSE
jgi:hypothetical protein